MEPFRYHVYACEQKKPDGLPCCAARGALKTIDALRRELGKQGLVDTVQVTACGSLGLCERGPNLVVYPDGIWYSGVTAADVPELVREHFQQGRPLERLVNRDENALRQEVTGNRNAYLGMMKAKDAAGVVPDELQAMIRGFMESRIVLTGIELDVFTAVQDGATAAAVAAARATEPRATAVLLDALAALELLVKQDGSYRPAPVAARFLVAGAPDDATTALKHNLSLWDRWSTLTACVRAGTSVSYQEMTERDASWTVPFIAAMHRNAALRAPLVVRAVGPGGALRLLDVGGGSGAYAIAFAQASPSLRAEIFDLPTVTPIARGHIAAAGLADRVTTRDGDLRQDDLGGGHDLVLISAICHMLDPAQNQDLLRRVHAALQPGGRVVIQDHVLDADRTSPRAGALFAVNMLVGTQAGGTYSEDEYTAWLTGAGFTDVRRVKLPGPSDLMIARR
ncbi:MAG TPA: methyltransferase [Polyangia bacterium]|jgi:(2Fe-2S) ferredoxin/predicted O-methyltransferase YrrM